VVVLIGILVSLVAITTSTSTSTSTSESTEFSTSSNFDYFIPTRLDATIAANRANYSAVALGGYVYVLGGFSLDVGLAIGQVDVYRFDGTPVYNNSWKIASDEEDDLPLFMEEMPTPRGFMSVASYGEEWIVTVGGDTQDPASNGSRAVEVLNVRTGQWFQSSNQLQMDRIKPSIGVFRDGVLVMLGVVQQQGSVSNPLVVELVNMSIPQRPSINSNWYPPIPSDATMYDCVGAVGGQFVPTNSTIQSELSPLASQSTMFLLLCYSRVSYFFDYDTFAWYTGPDTFFPSFIKATSLAVGPPYFHTINSNIPMFFGRPFIFALSASTNSSNTTDTFTNDDDSSHNKNRTALVNFYPCLRVDEDFACLDGQLVYSNGSIACVVAEESSMFSDLIQTSVSSTSSDSSYSPWPTFQQNSYHNGVSTAPAWDCFPIDDSQALRWIFPTDGAIVSSPVINENGTVFIGSFDSYFYAIDGSTGLPQWKFATQNVIQSTALVCLLSVCC